MACWTRNQTFKWYYQWFKKTRFIQSKSNNSKFGFFCFSLANDGRTNETILQELSEKHKQKLADEKSKFQDLTSILDDYKVKI